MKTKLFLLGLVIILMSSCIKHKYIDIMCTLYIHTKDTITVDFPVRCGDKNISFKAIELSNDTVIEVETAKIYSWDWFDQIKLYMSRQTAHEEVWALFIDHDFLHDITLNDSRLPRGIFNCEDSLKYHILDSLTNVYGVTMPANQDVVTVPIASDKYSWIYNK